MLVREQKAKGGRTKVSTMKPLKSKNHVIQVLNLTPHRQRVKRKHAIAIANGNTQAGRWATDVESAAANAWSID
jgi:hypothetical protein